MHQRPIHKSFLGLPNFFWKVKFNSLPESNGKKSVSEVCKDIDIVPISAK